MSTSNSERFALRLSTLCVDCADAQQMAEFYCRILGWEIASEDLPETGTDGGWIALRNPSGGLGLSFQAETGYEPPTWPEEADQQAKMMHFEVAVADVEAAIDLVVAAGGRAADHQPPDRDPRRLRVMLDPAGHPFCLFSESDATP